MPSPRKASSGKKTSRRKPSAQKSQRASSKKSKSSTSARGKKGVARGKKKTALQPGSRTGGKSGGPKGRPNKNTGAAKTKRPPGRRGAAPPRPAVVAGPQRLQKVLAAAGVASRRECEQLVLEGRVEVDREVVTKLGTKVDPERQKIRVDGVVLKTARRVYFAVNKPPGVVSTARDPSGRPRVIDMIPETTGRVFTVGRLDMGSEGLILLTNDGELANQLAHPRYGVNKTYEVQVAGVPEVGLVKDLCRGIHLADGFVKADQAKIKRRFKQSTVIEIVLSEGKNREIRRMLARLGHKVQRLKRVAIGPLRMGELPQGHVRQLEPLELKRLRGAVTATPTSGRPPRTTSGVRIEKPDTKKASGAGKKRVTKKAGKKPVGKKTASARPRKQAAKPYRILTSPEDR